MVRGWAWHLVGHRQGFQGRRRQVKPRTREGGPRARQPAGWVLGTGAQVSVLGGRKSRSASAPPTFSPSERVPTNHLSPRDKGPTSPAWPLPTSIAPSCPFPSMSEFHSLNRYLLGISQVPDMKGQSGQTRPCFCGAYKPSKLLGIPSPIVFIWPVHGHLLGLRLKITSSRKPSGVPLLQTG